jgi:hypothetical protein
MIALEKERSLHLTPRLARRLACHSGVLWLTREGDPRDVFLGAGDVVEIGRGHTIVMALEASTVTLLLPQPWWRGFAALALRPRRWRWGPMLRKA